MNEVCIPRSSSSSLASEEVSDSGETVGQERVYSIHRIAPEPYPTTWKVAPKIQKKTNLMDIVGEQLETPETFDVSVVIGNESFNCLMMILQSYSKYFKVRSRHDKVITLPRSKITEKIFGKIYEWMLMESKAVERESLIPMLIGAQFLQMEPLEQQIWHLIQDGERFQENEAFLLYLEAREWYCEKVQSMMMNRVQRFFLTVVCSEEFLKMEPFEVRSWLKLNNIGINLEVEIFYAAVRWMFYDWETRKEYLMELMKVVRFGLFAPWRIVEYRHNKNMGRLEKVLENSELQNLLETSLSYATYRNCFQDDTSEHFADFLQRFGFNRLYQRETFDRSWQMRYKDSPYTFDDFEDYLEEVRTTAVMNWKQRSA